MNSSYEMLTPVFNPLSASLKPLLPAFPILQCDPEMRKTMLNLFMIPIKMLNLDTCEFFIPTYLSAIEAPFTPLITYLVHKAHPRKERAQKLKCLWTPSC